MFFLVCVLLFIKSGGFLRLEKYLEYSWARKKLRNNFRNTPEPEKILEIFLSLKEFYKKFQKYSSAQKKCSTQKSSEKIEKYSWARKNVKKNFRYTHAPEKMFKKIAVAWKKIQSKFWKYFWQWVPNKFGKNSRKIFESEKIQKKFQKHSWARKNLGEILGHIPAPEETSEKMTKIFLSFKKFQKKFGKHS